MAETSIATIDLGEYLVANIAIRERPVGHIRARFGRSGLPAHCDADDIFQESWLRVHARGPVELRRSAIGFLRRGATNLIRDEFKRRMILLKIMVDLRPVDAVEDRTDHRSSILERLLDEVAALPDRQRGHVEMRLEEVKSRRIAELLAYSSPKAAAEAWKAIREKLLLRCANQAFDSP